MSHPLKYDEGKYDPTLVEPWVVKAIAAVYQEGVDKKYSRGSWKKFEVEKARELIAPAIRHLDAYRDGEFIDPDGGNPHLIKAVWNLLTVYYHEERNRNAQPKKLYEGREALLSSIRKSWIQEGKASPDNGEHGDESKGHPFVGIQMPFVW